nr:DNA-binding protein [Rhizobium lusitanum]
MVTIVDTNVLVDLAIPGSAWHGWSSGQVFSAFKQGPVVINPIIYAEFSVRYSSMDRVDELLPQSEFRRESLPWSAAFARRRPLGSTVRLVAGESASFLIF